MMMSEFNEILHEVSPTHREPTKEEYEKIETVYAFHPAIGEKEDIVLLWANYGMTIIDDMMPRSRAIMTTYDELQKAKARYDKAKEAYDAFFK